MLIQSKEDIERPQPTLRARPLFDTSIRGVIFDMDGTLTTPGQIDFTGIRRALGIGEEADILSHVDALVSAEAREEALRFIQAEELKGFQTIDLQPGAEELIDWLAAAGYNLALATRNNMECVVRLQEAFNWHDTFQPALARVRKSRDDQHKVRERPHPSS